MMIDRKKRKEPKLVMGYLLLLTTLCFSSLSFARGFYSGAQSLGLVDSGRAGLESSEASFLNPSLLGFARSEVMLSYADGSPLPSSHTTNYGVTLVEASPDNFSPGSLSYRKLRRFGFGSTAPVNGELWHGALGKLISPHLAFGISVFRLTYKPEGGGGDIPEQWNGSLGFTYLPFSNLGLSYVLDSPVKAHDKIPVGLREQATHSLAAFYKPVENARLRVDLSKQTQDNPTENMDLATSFEVKSSNFFFVRLGHKWEGLSAQNKWGWGLGFVGPRLAIDYGFQQNLRNSETMHGVDLRILF